VNAAERKQLEAFAEEHLGSGDLANLDTDALAAKGYDVETIVQWIVSYNRLPALARRFDFEQCGRSNGQARGFGLVVRRRRSIFG